MKKLLFSALVVIVTASATMAQQRIYLDMSKKETFSLTDARLKKLLPASDLNRFKELRKEYLKNGATQKGGNPSVFSITGAMAFYTMGVDTMAAYFNHLGSTGPLDQVGFQIGKASASMFDTTMVQYVTAVPAGQEVFVRKNLESGVQYRFKFFVFDALAGTVTFYPSGNASYYATTVFVPMASIVEFSMSCMTKKFYFWRDNNATMTIKGRVDTLANFSSPYLPTYGVIIPVTRTSTNGATVLDSINLASYMVAPDTIVSYFVELSITYNSTPLDSTNVETCTVNTTAVHELDGKIVFNLFPNPATSNFTVESNTAGTMTLFNSVGQEIRTLHFEAGPTTIERMDLPPGMYFYRMVNEDGTRLIGAGKVQLQ